VAFRTAKAGKPHTFGEDLTAAKKIVNIMLEEKAWKEVNAVSLSNDTVQRRIGENVEELLIARICDGRFYALQLDKYTDFTNLPNILAFLDMNVMET
jgi:hypothetical protein